MEHKNIENCISACKDDVSYSNYSTKATGELKRKNRKTLQQYVTTRWSSTYYMLNSLIENRAAIYAGLHNKGFTKPPTAIKLEIKNEHWLLMEKTL